MNKRTKGWMALGVTAVLAAALPMGANAAEVKTGGGASSLAISVKPIALSKDQAILPGKAAVAGSITSVRIGAPAEIAKLLGMDGEALGKELASGKSLLEIAESRGVSKEALIEAQVSLLAKPLEEAVKAGKLTQEKADQLKADLAKHAEAMITAKGNAPFTMALPAAPLTGGEGPTFSVQIGADQELLSFLGLDEAAFASEIKSGKTILEIAEAKGITKEQLVEFETKRFNARIDQAVKDGHMTEEQAAKAKEAFSKRAEQGFDGKGAIMMPAIGVDGVKGSIRVFNGGPLAELTPSGELPELPMMKDHAIAVSLLPDDELLSFLGIDKKTFQEEMKNGKTLLEIAESKGITKEQFIEFQTKQFNAKIDEAVKNGALSEEEAAKIKETFSAGAEQRLSGGPFALPLHIQRMDRVELNDEAFEAGEAGVLLPALPLEGQATFFSTFTTSAADLQA